MKALRKLTAGPGLELVDLPEPEVGPEDVKIRVERTGICGTDLHIDAWDAWAASAIKAPLTPGHEFSGRIVELGSSVKSLNVGDHVSGEGHIVCGVCRNCRAGRRQLCIRTVGVGVNRDGAFAEYVVIPASNVWVHHGDVDPDVAAIFDPFGNAVHVALSFPLVGEDVLITGAGPIGLMVAEVARFAGARYIAITDVNDQRLDLARKMGVDVGINVARESIADAQKTLGMTEGFDIGFEMSGHATALPDIISNLTHGGRVAVLGLPTQPIALDWAKVVTHMITIKGIYGREMYESWYAMSAMLQKGLDIAPVITDRFPASQWAEAFATARSGTGGKVVMDWS